MAPTPHRTTARIADPFGPTSGGVPDGAVADRLYGLDIETDTSVDGLDPATAAVIAVGLATPEGDEVFLGEEPTMLARLDRRLAELPPGVLVTWNGGSFDLPFLAARARVTGSRLALRLWPTPCDRPPGPVAALARCERVGSALIGSPLDCRREDP